uniref:Uncharacterized protein n=1 Tax=viral metagenome TaxID=1070528 RepID=A0A6C0CHN4_9ZZZZ
MSEKEFIKDGLDNEKIVEIIKDIRKEIDIDASDSNIDKIKAKHNFFATRYPALFDLSTRKEEFSWENLNYFLNMRNDVINDKLTAEKASVIVGEEWFKKYVKVDDKPMQDPIKFERRTKSKK